MEMNRRIKSFWEGEAQVYSKGIKEELDSPQKEEWKRLILSYANAKGKLDILDSGCGPGFFPIILSEEGHSVTGIDITENMIACAKENAEEAGADAEFLTMDCQALDFPDNSFDLVISRNITWTLDDPSKAYREWLRVLKPGGRLLVFDACWYLHLFDDELGKLFYENEARLMEKYGRPTHSHNDRAEEEALSKLLFMSDKIRPAWDLEYMLSIGFRKVFSERDITDRVCHEYAKDAYKISPQFLVGGEK